jgi:hypothetical protein
MTDRTFYMYAPTVTVTRKATRQRRPSLASAIKQASKAGAVIAGAVVKPDGSVALQFGKEGCAVVKPDGSVTFEFNEWDRLQ